MLPSDYPEVQPYKDLTELFKNQVDMQFDDLRTLLRLPLTEHELNAGCNLATAVALFNLIAGASVCLYDASFKSISNRVDRARRFKAVLRDFYPWQNDGLSVDEAVDCIYDAARNPLSHSFGLDDPTQSPYEVILQKESLSTNQIIELEDAPKRPAWAKSTIISMRLRSIGTTVVILSVPTLFWGVHRMFHSLVSNPNQAAAANALAGQYKNHWLKFVSDLGTGI